MPTPFRDLKRKMRRDRHTTMMVPAFYYPAPASPTPVAVTVRTHLRFKGANNGALPGGGEDSIYARMVEAVDKIVFRTAELPMGKPRQGSIISVERGEAYLVEAVDPSDDDEVHAKVSRIPATDARLASWQVPE